MRKVLFVVPYKARDLEGHTLVGYHLQNRYGFEVVYTNGYGIEKKLLDHAPDALVLDHLAWNFKATQARLAKKLGMKVIVLPTEGLFQNKEAAVGVAGVAHGVTSIVDLYLAWGDFARTAILEKNLISEQKIHTIGCPRFDLYREPYTSLMDSRANFLRGVGISDSQAPLIVWTTNTPYAARDPKTTIERYVKQAGWTRDKILRIIEDNDTQLRTHSHIILELARLHPEWNFVIKVHPAEWINPYVPLTRERDNIHLACNTSIREFIYHCDVLLQRNCTTATEAWILNKPVIQMEAGTYDMRARAEYKSGNHNVATIEEADQAVSAYLSGECIPVEVQCAREAFISDFYHDVDGMASERCAKLISGVLSPPHYTDADRAQTQARVSRAYASWKKEEDRHLANRIKDLLSVDRSMSLRFWDKFQKREGEINPETTRAEAEITPEMASQLYDRYRALGTPGNEARPDRSRSQCQIELTATGN